MKGKGNNTFNMKGHGVNYRETYYAPADHDTSDRSLRREFEQTSKLIRPNLHITPYM